MNPIIVNPIIQITNSLYNDNTQTHNVYRREYMSDVFISNIEANIQAAKELEDWFMETFGTEPNEANIQQLQQERQDQEQRMEAQREERRRLYALGLYELEEGEILE